MRTARISLVEMRRIMLARPGGSRIPCRRPSSLSHPERILIVRLSHLGDVVCTLAVFHALHAAYPAARIAWVVQPEFADLLRGLSGLSRTISFHRRRGWRAWRELRSELRDYEPDLAVDAQGNLKSALVTWCSGAPRRLGFARPDWREPLGAFVSTSRARRTPRDRPHLLDRVGALVEHAAPGTAALRFDAALDAAERERGERALRSLVPASEAAVLVHVSAPGDVRGWPAERWKELTRALRASGRRVLLLSGPREEALGRALAAELAGDLGVGHLVGQRDLRELAGLFHAAASDGHPLVACDSGPMHLGWASGMRVVLLAGPQDAGRTGPWPARNGPHRVVRAAREPDCAPCLARACSHADGPVCMTGIDPPSVLAAL